MAYGAGTTVCRPGGPGLRVREKKIPLGAGGVDRATGVAEVEGSAATAAAEVGEPRCASPPLEGTAAAAAAAALAPEVESPAVASVDEREEPGVDSANVRGGRGPAERTEGKTHVFLHA